ncbi:low-specificity L-threonine aldolase [Alkalihalobacillus sp. MEB130]|uniref:low-specificity L-threonine aldolase n=1 Tax=Alkalihalobacillus sp. MEB130 TaxID=2976704 RepID=UPI0028DF7157|nr:low-specificity L-threonine aldolase [Alkalihalobacillus sp. MEB130]MDT8860108.1 low-specificity L-threonine aldolase [Alkalihalobacillus sp. MEB130]
MIDLRSDTITKPTEAMRKAMYEAEVGDDVYNEDPTISQLEELAADLLGKEKALFVTSGTQGNQIAVLSHCVPGNEVLLEKDSHIFYYEGGAISAFAGVQTRTISSINGAMDSADVQSAIRGNDIHEPETGLICLENTHNRAGGAIVPISNMEAIFNVATKAHVPIHLDGARLFNAAVAEGKTVKEFTQFTSTVQICLSKGLGAPVGSIIAGSHEFITKARKWRKRLGGGLRQAGVLAAPGIIALTEMVDRLAVDHQHAQHFAEGVKNITGISVINAVDTNIVLVDTTAKGITSKEYIERLKEEGILAVSFGPTTVRFTTHYDVTKEQIEQALVALQKI